MNFYFLINNFHFALELTGAVALLAAAWLTFDTYSVRKEGATLARAIGLGLFALWQVIYALNINDDVLSYVGFIVFLVGLLLILASFLKSEQLRVQAVLILPAFALWEGYLYVAATVLLFAIAYLAYRKSSQEFNATWIPFALSFGLLGLASAGTVYVRGDIANPLYLIVRACELVSFIFLVRWVWQFLALRVRESLVLIFVSAALFLSTVVTLAFSTILIGQITAQTEANLLTDARVLHLNITGLEEESAAKVGLIATQKELKDAIAKNDFAALELLTEQFMSTYNLGFLTVTDGQGDVLVRAHALSRRGDSLGGERAFEEALAGNTFVTIEEGKVEQLSIRAAAPIIEEGEVSGVVIAGYPLDNALVDNIKRITGLEMFIYKDDSSVAATALHTDGRTRLTGIAIDNAQVKTVVLQEGKTVTAGANMYGRPFLASYLPLQNGDGKIIGMISAAKPQQDILDLANATNRLTLITVICIMFILVWPIYRFTKRLSEAA